MLHLLSILIINDYLNNMWSMEYMRELREGGCPKNIREDILTSGFKGYARMWMPEFKNQGFVNRPGKATTTKGRAKNKLARQTNWLKQTKSNTQDKYPGPKKKKPDNRKNNTNIRVERVLFFPYT